MAVDCKFGDCEQLLETNFSSGYKLTMLTESLNSHLLLVYNKYFLVLIGTPSTTEELNDVKNEEIID